MLKTTKFLVLVTMAAGLAACASQDKKVVRTYERDEPIAQQRDTADQPRRGWQAPATQRSVTTYESTTYQQTPTTQYDSSRSSGSWAQPTYQPQAVTSFDYSRRDEYQRDLTGRIDSASREIDALHASAAPATECERRMRYLQQLRDSLRDKAGEISNVPADAYASRAMDLEERYTVIERFLQNDRSACTASR